MFYAQQKSRFTVHKLQGLPWSH